MKKTKVNIILIVVMCILILAVLGCYLYEVFYLKVPYDKHLFRAIALLFVFLATLVRLSGGRGRRRRIEDYEKAYENELGYAFKNKPVLRKKLLCACRLYDESNYRKALKYLHQLLSEAAFERDAIPVLLFIALCYTDAGLNSEAIRAYYELLRLDSNNAQVHSNLGLILVSEGDFEAALEHYNKSIELKPKNYYAYINRANYYFRKREYDNAISDAKHALECNNSGVEAASLLTIVYALQGDEENKKHYYHISITSGKDPEELNEAIIYFLNEQNIPSKEEEE